VIVGIKKRAPAAYYCWCPIVFTYLQQLSVQLPQEVPQQLEQSLHEQSAFAEVEVMLANTVPMARRPASAAIKILVFILIPFKV